MAYLCNGSVSILVLRRFGLNSAKSTICQLKLHYCREWYYWIVLDYTNDLFCTAWDWAFSVELYWLFDIIFQLEIEFSNWSFKLLYSLQFNCYWQF